MIKRIDDQMIKLYCYSFTTHRFIMIFFTIGRFDNWLLFFVLWSLYILTFVFLIYITFS